MTRRWIHSPTTSTTVDEYPRDVSHAGRPAADRPRTRPTSSSRFSDDTLRSVLAALGINTFFLGRRGVQRRACNTDLVSDPRNTSPSHAEPPARRQHAAHSPSRALRNHRHQRARRAFEPARLLEPTCRGRRDPDQRRPSTSYSADSGGQGKPQGPAAGDFSGVNADEETINLMNYQRMYQANARFLTVVVDELMQPLLSIN